MDHCEAIRNAAQAGRTVGAEVRVVDCIVHVERSLIIHQNLLVARGAADEEEDDDEEEGEPQKEESPPYFLMLLERMPRCYPRSPTGRSFSGLSKPF
jgi:hypothetical protein